MNPSKSLGYSKLISLAADKIKKAEAILFTSGAGMSVESGLDDFRGPNGIIPKLKLFEKDLDYRDIINPQYLKNKPERFWYIYGDRYNKYLNV